MARLNVTPTRMELSRLKDRLTVSVRGHKLLKDKQDELVRQFIALVHENRRLRTFVEASLAEIVQDSILAGSSFPEEVIGNAFLYRQSPWTVDIKERNLMGFSVPSMTHVKSDTVERDGLWAPSPPLSQAALKMQALVPKLLELAQVEKTCMLLSQEIEKVRRRVNALEYMTIPQLRETIRYIKMKLEDNEREGIIRMIKGKSYTQ